MPNPSLALEPTDTALTIGKAMGGLFLFGPLGLGNGVISSTKGADAACVANLGAFGNKADLQGNSAQ